MTVQHVPPAGVFTPAQPTGRLSEHRRCGDLELAVRQLEAVDRFHRARHMAELAAASAAASRETRMDSARRLDVLRRQHQALIARAHAQLRGSGQGTFHSIVDPRVVLAHRNDWFRDKVARTLRERGLRIISEHDNGADAIGETIAEQPDLLLVEDTLAMVSGEQVVREVRRLSSGTSVVAQVPCADRVGALLDAGAIAVFTRRVPPLDVALAMQRLLVPA